MTLRNKRSEGSQLEDTKSQLAHKILEGTLEGAGATISSTGQLLGVPAMWRKGIAAFRQGQVEGHGSKSLLQ